MSPNDPSPWQPPAVTGTPPPPPPGRPSAPPPPPGSPPGVPAVGYGTPPGYPAPGYGTPPVLVGAAKPPRPASPIGGVLMIAGAVIAAVGCFLPWLTIADTTINGFDEGPDDAALGGGVIFFALVLLGMGITTLAAKRILPIAIIGIVAATLCLLVGAAQLADYSDFADVPFFDAEIGPGLVVVVLGSLVALAGGIVACAKRRKW